MEKQVVHNKKYIVYINTYLNQSNKYQQATRDMHLDGHSDGGSGEHTDVHTDDDI